jgi:hypothetical protein
LDIGGVKEMSEFRDNPLKGHEKTTIQKLLSLPDTQRAIILFGILIDPSSAMRIFRLNESISEFTKQVIEELIAMDRDVRIPLVVTLLKDSFHAVDSGRGLDGTK